MRLILGTKDNPRLLVEVHQEYSPTHFEFWVINGAWEGTFYNGYITIYGCPSGDFSSLDQVEILTDNQDRLRTTGWHDDPERGYQSVFDNFHNPNYVAPKPKPVIFEDMDDDIPF
jgi:hypothetical protein